MLEEPTFDTLRTKEALGYVAQLVKFIMRDVTGAMIVV